MSKPKNKPNEKQVQSDLTIRNIDLSKALDKPQDQYTCLALNEPKIARAFIKGFFENNEYFPSLNLPKLKVEKRDMHDNVVFKDSQADIHYSIPLVNDPDERSQVIILAEHKSYYDPWVIVQLEHYVSIVLYQHSPKYKKSRTKVGDSEQNQNEQCLLPPIIPIVIYNGEKPYPGPRRLSDLYQHVDGMKKPFLDFEPIIIDLSTIPFDDLPDNPNEWRLNAVLRALKSGTMKDPDFKEFEKNFRLMLDRYDPQNPEDVRFVQLTVRYYLDGSHVNPDQLVTYINDNYPVSDDGVKDMTLTAAEQLIQRGERRGFEQGDKHGFERGDKYGFERGIEQGIEQETERNVLANRKTLTKVLKSRFKTVPLSVQKKIKLTHDNIALQSLIVEAALCESMDEFKENLL